MNEKVKKIVKWIAVIAAAIGAAAAVIIEQGCTHKHMLKANGIKIDTIEVSTSTKIKKYGQQIQKLAIVTGKQIGRAHV